MDKVFSLTRVQYTFFMQSNYYLDKRSQTHSQGKKVKGIFNSFCQNTSAISLTESMTLTYKPYHIYIFPLLSLQQPDQNEMNCVPISYLFTVHVASYINICMDLVGDILHAIINDKKWNSQCSLNGIEFLRRSKLNTCREQPIFSFKFNKQRPLNVFHSKTNATRDSASKWVQPSQILFIEYFLHF